MPAWNGWYHCMSNTYGTWLAGDPRGFRTRKHREHVEGDYNSPPPPGKYTQLHERSKQLLKRPPVFLSRQARQVCVEAMLCTWVEIHQMDVLALSVGRSHMHVLARFGRSLRLAEDDPKPTPNRGGLRERDPARFFMAIAKERSSKALLKQGLVSPGGVWAKRGKIVAIADRAHQLNVYRYILAHKAEQAAVWSYQENHQDQDH